MVDFVQLQQLMKDRVERDRAIRSVEAQGMTLDEAVSAAAALLAVPVKNL